MITELVSKEELSTTNSMNASFERVNNSMSASFESVKTLRDLNDKLARAEAHCVGNLDILEKLEQSSFFDDNAKEALVAEVSRYKEYIRSTNSLHERLRSITELVRMSSSFMPIHANIDAGGIQPDHCQPARSIES